MRKIMLHEKDSTTISFAGVDHKDPIFAYRHGELEGMIVQEDGGWILRTGGNSGSSGYHKTLRECLERDMEFGYEFFV